MNKYSFCFESYGVPVAIETSAKELIEAAEKTARSALLGNLKEIDRKCAEQFFQLELLSNQECRIIQNGEAIATGEPGPKFWKFFDSLVRILVAEYCKSLVFVHAGVVGWRGKALVFPGDSFAGKTTLVAELIRNGAEYYSDEYALFDADGLVHPFARYLSLRSDGQSVYETQVPAEELGGRSAELPKPIGCVLFSNYSPEAEWNPQILSVGKGLMEILPQTIAIRRNTEFAINILKKAITSAIIVKSARPDATGFVRKFLEFVDNTAF
jgi:hypothetical protein